VFPVLHGTFGEDGTLQGLLEMAGLPYVGAGVLASSVSMDKEITKRLCVERNLPVIGLLVQFRGRLMPTQWSALSSTCLCEAGNLGSSSHHQGARPGGAGICAGAGRRIRSQGHRRALDRGAGDRMLSARQRQPVASTPCEILPSQEFYDYDDKYILDQAEFRVPACLARDVMDEVRRLAVECYRAVECEGMARVDFLVEGETGRIYINEINTIPGFTSISMYPKMLEHDGLAYPKLIDRLIELALERHAVKRARATHVEMKLLAPLALLVAASAAAEENIEPLVKRVIDVFSVVEQNAADPAPPERAFYEGAIPGMLRRLDPHSTFFDPGQFDQLRELERATTKGFGSVVSVVPGALSYCKRFRTRRRAVGVGAGRRNPLGKRRAAGRTQPGGTDRPARRIEATGGALEVLKARQRAHTPIRLTPQQMQSPSVDRAFCPRRASGTCALRASIRSRQAGAGGHRETWRRGAQRLVLDLRNNPGGLMPPALETAALFLKPGRWWFPCAGAKVEAAEVKVPEGAKPYTFPVALLMNSRSASASEIVAGALQDLKRATIVGEPSFGKGLVQSVYPLSQGTGMALTTAFYYTPGGRSISAAAARCQLDAATATGAGGIRPDQVVLPRIRHRCGRCSMPADRSPHSLPSTCA